MSKKSLYEQINTEYRNEKEVNDMKERGDKSIAPSAFDYYNMLLKEGKTYNFIPSLADTDGNLYSTDNNGIKCILRADVFKKTFIYYNPLNPKMRQEQVGKTIKTIVKNVDERDGVVDLAGDPRFFRNILNKDIERELKKKENGENIGTITLSGTVIKVTSIGVTINILDYGIRGFIEKIDWASFPFRRLEDICHEGDVITFDVIGTCPKKGKLPIQFKCDHKPYAEDPWKSIPDIEKDSIILVTCKEKPKGKTYWWGTSNNIPGIEMQCDYSSSFNVVENGIYKCFIRSFDKDKYICRVTPFEFIDVDTRGLIKSESLEENETRTDEENETNYDNNIQYTSVENNDLWEDDTHFFKKESLEYKLTDEEKRLGYTIGLVNVAFGKGFAFINSFFINKSFMESPENPIPKGLLSPGKAKMDFTFSSTSTNSFLIKYVEGDIEEDERYGKIHGVNYDYPIILLDKFRKKEIKSITINGESVEIIRVDDATSKDDDVDAGVKRALEKKKKESEYFFNGEQYFCVKKDKSVELRRFSDKKAKVRPDDVLELDDQVESVYRIGIVTSLYSDTGVINGNVVFNISCMEKKAHNILLAVDNATRGSLHVMYRQKESSVVEVARIPDQFLNIVSWSEDVVEDVNVDHKIIRLNSHAVHYLSVTSDGYICNLFSQGELSGTKVFVRKIKHPFQNDKIFRISTVALEIRSVAETGTVNYNEQEDTVYYCRNTSFCYPLVGNPEQYKLMDGEKIEVIFDLSADEKSLVAYPKNDFINKKDSSESKKGTTPTTESKAEKSKDIATSSTGKEDEDVSDSIKDSILVKFLIATAKDSDIILKKPQKKAKQNSFLIARILVGRGLRKDREEDIFTALSVLQAANLAGVTVDEKNVGAQYYRNEDLIIKGLTKRAKKVINNPDGIYGEYSYYIATILQYAFNRNYRAILRYYMFVQDFLKREELLQIVRKGEWNWSDSDLNSLFDRQIIDVQEFLSHILMLDKSSALECINIIKKHKDLSDQIVDWLNEGRNLPINENEKIDKIIQNLKKNFVAEKKKIVNGISLEGMSIYEKISFIGENINGGFFKFICRDDVNRFIETCEINSLHTESEKESDFGKRTRQLTDMIVSCDNLSKEIKDHPTQYALELLANEDGIINTFREKVLSELNSLYSSAEPLISCKPNSNITTRNTKNLFLLLSNVRDTGNQSLNLQDARNLKIDVSADTFGLEVFAPKVSGRVINAGETVTVEIPIDMSGIAESVQSIYLSYQLSYDYYDGFESIKNISIEDTLALNIQTDSDKRVDKNKENPYQKYELADKPSIENDMFFGRDRELDQIKDHLIEENQFVPGKVLILFGQKKCGKTSLVSHFKESIVDELASRTILINFVDFLEENGGALSLENFNLNFYNNILTKFRSIVRKEHRDVFEMMKENDLSIPDISSNPSMASSIFFGFFDEFAEIDEGRHTIVLVMDEFTRFCTAIKEKKEYHSLANFVKAFAQLGFSQFIIGHDSMMRVLEYLGAINAIAEFSKTIELSSLEPADARKMIINPMKRTFGIDVYGTDLGKKAIEDLQYLSGNSPYYLMKLCSEVFKYYLDIDEDYLTHYHVDQVKKDYIQQICSERSLATFDTILTEDGDDNDYLEKTPTYMYLKTIALKSQPVVTRDCKSDTICEELGEKETEEIKNLLRSRHVIDERNGQVKIILGLFREYIIYNYGGRS